MISPEFERLSNEYHHIVFLKVDVDEVEVRALHAGLLYACWTNARPLLFANWLPHLAGGVLNEFACHLQVSLPSEHCILKTDTFLLWAIILQAVASACGISAMPTFQVWKGGEKIDELVGASKDRLKAMIEKHSG